MTNTQPTATPFEIFTLACDQGWMVVLETRSGPQHGRALTSRRSHGGMQPYPYRIKQGARTLEFRLEDVTAVTIP